ncbi:MAG: prepilin-type N-terminal cleavage/methylation domain-containing protein [Lentisphaerae bacterium]|nr:prepilin-type N-terminal cleavage/methylation domain-containing protein [Lentisphaerota bacterium]
MNTTGASHNRRAGFTLAEAIIAITISVFVLTGMVISFVSQTREYRRHRDSVEMRQNASAAATRVVQDLRLAGYGLPVPSSRLTQWITWVSGTTNVVRYINGASGAPDRLFLAGAFDPPAAALLNPIVRGNTSVTLQTGQGSQFNTTNRKLIFIDRQELARVTAVSGDVLTISTHPTLSPRGVRYPHAAGSPIELVQVVEYACDSSLTNSLRRPYLYRNDNRGVLTNRLQQLTTLGIQNFQVAPSTNGIALTFTAIAQRIDPAYTDPTVGDHYRRFSLTTTAVPRNPVP